MTHTSNGFERHNLDHLSASSINLWSNCPDLWVVQYLFGKRTGMSAAPWRGICVEDAVCATLMGESEEDAISKALEKFDARFVIGDEKTTKERDLIKPMVQVAIEELAEFGKPQFPEEGGQNKISITAKGADGSWSIPVIGFIDLYFPQHGLVVDIKSTTRVPSSMSPDHVRQRSIYAKAMGNCAVKFLYVSGKKASWLEDGDVAETLAETKLQIARLERFLRHCDKETARAIVPSNRNSFYWHGAEGLYDEFYGS
jgi:hypothetical protein